MNLSRLDEIKKILPKIREISLQCEEQFQEKCFEILLLDAIQGEKSQNVPLQINNGSSLTSGNIIPKSNLEFQNFIRHYGLDLNKINQVVDLDTGKIYTKKFGSSVASRQRQIAALIALTNCARNGQFVIQKEELRNQCEDLSSYDSKNFATNMKSTLTEKKAIVFDDKGDYWKVTPPGEEMISAIVKELCD